MRRLLVLVSAVVMVDTVLYAALAPLLPRYADELGLSKTGAGLLVAAYGTGVLIGALPAGIAAARFGPRRAVLAWLVAGTPRERRGEMLGTALGAAIFGALLGPMLGASADLAGPEVAFSGV